MTCLSKHWQLCCVAATPCQENTNFQNTIRETKLHSPDNKHGQKHPLHLIFTPVVCLPRPPVKPMGCNSAERSMWSITGSMSSVSSVCWGFSQAGDWTWIRAAIREVFSPSTPSRHPLQDCFYSSSPTLHQEAWAGSNSSLYSTRGKLISVSGKEDKQMALSGNNLECLFDLHSDRMKDANKLKWTGSSLVLWFCATMYCFYSSTSIVQNLRNYNHLPVTSIWTSFSISNKLSLVNPFNE